MYCYKVQLNVIRFEEHSVYLWFAKDLEKVNNKNVDKDFVKTRWKYYSNNQIYSYDILVKRCSVCIFSNLSFKGVHVIPVFILFVYMYVYWCQTRFPYQMTSMSFMSSTSWAWLAFPSGASEFIHGFSN